MTARGDLVLVVIPGAYGKPRPALVVQSDLLAELPSVIVCPLTTTLRDDVPNLRIDVAPNLGTGLREPSQIAVDKLTTVPASKLGGVIGRAEPDLLAAVDRALLLVLGLA